MEKCDAARFDAVCRDIMLNGGRRSGIGTYGEKLLHVILKKYYAEDEAHHEIPVCGCVADIFDGDTVTEIQTGSFYPLKNKLAKFVEAGYHVTVVHPIFAVKWIRWMDPETGEISEKRRSPKRGSEYELLSELIYLLPLVGVGKVTYRTVMLECEEYRILNGWSADRKKGSERCETIPVRLISESDYSAVSDFSVFLPEGMPNSFSAKDFSKISGLKGRRLSAALKVLTSLGVAKRNGKRGREYLYTRCEPAEAAFLCCN